MSFTPQELRDEIQKTLNSSVTIPAGHRGAFVTYVDDAGVRVAVATKIGDTWQVSGTLGWHDHQDGLNYGINVMKTW